MPQQTGFFHNVFFWLRDGAEAADASRLANGCTTHLTAIPGVLRLTVGFPAGTDWGVVDNSYGVALLVEFADAAAHDVYQDHPDHLRFIEECGKFWSRVQVYDTVLVVLLAATAVVALEPPMRRRRDFGLLAGLTVIVPLVAWTATSCPVAAFDAMVGNGVVVQDAAHGVGQALQGAAQGYVSNVVSQEEQAKEQANMAQWFQQAVQRHHADGHGWDVINSAIKYSQLSPGNQVRLRQQFAEAAAQSGPH